MIVALLNQKGGVGKTTLALHLAGEWARHGERTLTVVGFPTATHPGILDELNRLAFPYRWSTRAILLDKTEAVRLLTKIRRQWFAKRKSIAAIVKEVMTNGASTLMDSDAANKAADADQALQELGADDVGQAYVTATVTVWDEDSGLAAEKLRLVEKVIQGRDFTCMAEGVNALEAWLGSIPAMPTPTSASRRSRR